MSNLIAIITKSSESVEDLALELQELGADLEVLAWDEKTVKALSKSAPALLFIDGRDDAIEVDDAILEIRADKRLSELPVLALAKSSEHANGCFESPVDPTELIEAARQFVDLDEEADLELIEDFELLEDDGSEEEFELVDEEDFDDLELIEGDEVTSDDSTERALRIENLKLQEQLTELNAVVAGARKKASGFEAMVQSLEGTVKSQRSKLVAASRQIRKVQAKMAELTEAASSADEASAELAEAKEAHAAALEAAQADTAEALEKAEADAAASLEQAQADAAEALEKAEADAAAALEQAQADAAEALEAATNEASAGASEEVEAVRAELAEAKAALDRAEASAAELDKELKTKITWATALEKSAAEQEQTSAALREHFTEQLEHATILVGELDAHRASLLMHTEALTERLAARDEALSLIVDCLELGKAAMGKAAPELPEAPGVDEARTAFAESLANDPAPQAAQVPERELRGRTPKKGKEPSMANVSAEADASESGPPSLPPKLPSPNLMSRKTVETDVLDLSEEEEDFLDYEDVVEFSEDDEEILEFGEDDIIEFSEDDEDIIELSEDDEDIIELSEDDEDFIEQS